MTAETPVQEKVPEEAPEQVKDPVPDPVPDQVPDPVPDQVPEEVPEQVPEQVKDKVPDQVSNEVPNKVPNKIPNKIQGKRASEPGAKRMRRPLILSAIFAVLATLLLADLAPRYAPGLLRFEHYMGDVRTALLSDQLPSQHPSVAILAITDDTLAGYRTYLPVDRDLLARVVEAVDAAGAKAIGLDFLFTSPATDGSDVLLIDAIRRARAKVVLAAADERTGLTEAQRDKQQAFFREAERPAGYSNLATERDSVVRFMAQPYADAKPAFAKSFPAQLAESA